MIEASGLVITPPGAGAPVLRGISISARPGEWIALVGPNGGGKTSLVLALAGLWPVSAGRLELEGRPLETGARGRRCGRVGVVLQDPSSQLLAPTVAEEIAFSARNLGHGEDEVARSVGHWSAALGLEADLDRDPATLSAGRQQMVLLAAALAARPRLLLADEPTAHVDAEGRGRVRAVMAGELAAGLAVVWATQDPDERAAASRVVEIGGPGPSGQTAGTGAGQPSGRPILRVRISPRPAGRGPRVVVPEALELEVAERGITALTGPNGTGKSVVLAATAGLETPDQVRVEWIEPPRLPPIIALQYPELQVFEERVEDELVFAAVARGLGRDRAVAESARLLEALGFTPDRFMARRTWTLSTGEKRLVEVVGALVAPSSLVLVDEPTAGLDPARRAALASVLALSALQTPVLVASQDTPWLEGLGGRVLTLGGNGSGRAK